MHKRQQIFIIAQISASTFFFFITGPQGEKGRDGLPGKDGK